MNALSLAIPFQAWITALRLFGIACPHLAAVGDLMLSLFTRSVGLASRRDELVLRRLLAGARRHDIRFRAREHWREPAALRHPDTRHEPRGRPVVRQLV